MKSDLIALAGILLIIGGIAAWSKPAAAIVTGLIIVFLVRQSGSPAAGEDRG